MKTAKFICFLLIFNEYRCVMLFIEIINSQFQLTWLIISSYINSTMTLNLRKLLSVSTQLTF